MRSSRNKLIVACVGALAIAGGARASAHRLDEYLQAARIDLDPDRVTIELDLTPGVAVAPRIVEEIDTDRDGSISSNETRTYATRVIAELEARIDGQPLPLALTEAVLRSIDAFRQGDGVIRLRASAALPALDAGRHRLRYRNAHHRDIGVYLANALIPSTDRVAIVDQQRDEDQRELAIVFDLHRGGHQWWLPASAVGVLLIGALATVRRSGRTRRARV